MDDGRALRSLPLQHAGRAGDLVGGSNLGRLERVAEKVLGSPQIRNGEDAGDPDGDSNRAYSERATMGVVDNDGYGRPCRLAQTRPKGTRGSIRVYWQQNQSLLAPLRLDVRVIHRAIRHYPAASLLRHD
jgi:hypothetical protein